MTHSQLVAQLQTHLHEIASTFNQIAQLFGPPIANVPTPF